MRSRDGGGEGARAGGGRGALREEEEEGGPRPQCAERGQRRAGGARPRGRGAQPGVAVRRGQPGPSLP